MDKVVRNGMVGVIVTDGYGCGWSTWMYNCNLSFRERYLFCPKIIEWIETGKKDKFPIEDDNLPEEAKKNLMVEWVPEGSEFFITNYDGNETIHIYNDIHWILA